MTSERGEAGNIPDLSSQINIGAGLRPSSLSQGDGSKLRIALVDEFPMRQEITDSFLRMHFCVRTLRFANPRELVAALDQKTGNPSGVIFSVGYSSIVCTPFINLIKQLVLLLEPKPLILLADHDDIDQMVVAFQAGVRGYIPTSMNPNVVIQAIRMVLSGGVFAPATPQARAQLMARLRKVETHPNIAPRTPADIETFGQPNDTPPTLPCRRDTAEKLGHWPRRQLSVLALIIEGTPNKQIAQVLNMDESTVKSHVRQIMRKLGVANRTQVALCGRRLGISVAA